MNRDVGWILLITPKWMAVISAGGLFTGSVLVIVMIGLMIA
jgi:hypothetical protein